MPNVSIFFYLWRICRPPAPSVLIRFLWMMRSALNRIKNGTQFFPIFIFRVTVKTSSKIRVTTSQNDQKVTITRKIKIGKFWNLIFLSILPISDLLYKFELFWKKKLEKKNVVQKFSNIFERTFFFGPHQKATRIWEFFLGLVDHSRSRLVSTAY